MALVLAVLSLLPVLVGFLTAGDFPQLVFKPPLWLVRVVFGSRYLLIALSVVLYLSAIIVHLLVAPTSIAFLIVVGVLVLVLTYGAFFAEPTLLFPAIQQHPTWITSQQASSELAPDDLVLVVEVNSDVRAYPVKWMTRPHIVRDTVGGEPVTMTYCALSHLGKAFRAESAGQEMNLAVAMQVENNLVYYDRTSKQLVQQITGMVLSGKAARAPRSEYPTRMMPWSACSALYPRAQVFSNPPRGYLDQLIVRFVSSIVDPHLSMTSTQVAFPTIKRFDPRLPPKSRVIGVEHHGRHKAYSLTSLLKQQVVNATVGEIPIVVLYDSVRDIVDVFERTQQAEVLTFHLVSASPDFVVQDEESQSQWNIKGEAIAGPAQGQRLQLYPHASRVLWMIWSNFFPDTQLDEHPIGVG
jgi:hypothetical protein